MNRLSVWFAGRAWARETRQGRRTTFRGFYRWAVERGHVTASPAHSLPAEPRGEPNPRPVPDSAYRIAVRMAGPRERLMIELAGGLGMRRAEVALCWPARDLLEDLDGWSLIVHGKGGRERVVPLDADLAAQLRVHEAGGGDLALTQDFLGHASPVTTRRYVKVRDGRLRAAVVKSRAPA